LLSPATCVGDAFMVTLLEYGQAILAKGEKPVEE
jgi:hypothetical protein